MKFTCNKKNLVESVSNVQRCVSSKSTLAALEGILIKTQENKIILNGYDLEIGMITETEAEILEEGAIVLSAKIFAEIIKKMPTDTIEIAVDKNKLASIKSGKSEFSLAGINADDFPEMPEIESENNIKIETKLLKSMIRQTVFAIAETDSKPIHTGSLFELRENEINIVSVDGYRLALRKEKTAEEALAKFVVPGKTLNEVLKLLPENEENVEILFDERHAIFNIEKYSIITRLLEGEFLDYNTAIPQSFSTEIKVNTKNLIETIERVSIIISDRVKSPIRCKIEESLLTISCNTSLGKAHDTMEIEKTGENFEIGFNNKYLLDALKNIETDEVKLLLNGPLNPLKLLPPQGENSVFLVLPVRLKANAE